MRKFLSCIIFVVCVCVGCRAVMLTPDGERLCYHFAFSHGIRKMARNTKMNSALSYHIRDEDVMQANKWAMEELAVIRQQRKLFNSPRRNDAEVPYVDIGEKMLERLRLGSTAATAELVMGPPHYYVLFERFHVFAYTPDFPYEIYLFFDKHGILVQKVAFTIDQ